MHESLIKEKLLQKVLEHRTTVEEIERECEENDEYSFEDSLALEFYEAKIEAYNLTIAMIDELNKEQVSAVKEYIQEIDADLEISSASDDASYHEGRLDGSLDLLALLLDSKVITKEFFNAAHPFYVAVDIKANTDENGITGSEGQ